MGWTDVPLTILLVEPDNGLRESVRLALREDGHRVWAFGTAASALASMTDLPDLSLLSAGDDPRIDALLQWLREPGSRSQVVWIAPPGDREVERLARRRHPRGLLARGTLDSEARKLADRVARTRERGRVLQGAPAMIGASPVMVEMHALLAKIASGGAPTVLVTGESGTGKEVAARTLHALGPRRDGPFVEVDCAAIPGPLMESELFGHEAGTFTDARESKMGLMELAQGGTVFLDEIGELEYGLQSKLLRVLDSRRLRRLGSSEETPLDIHLIAATNRNLEEEVRTGKFRADLFYRLDVVRVHLPPLRVRGSDVLLLAERFLEETARRLGRTGIRFSTAARTELAAYPWPGNIRELRNHIERLVLTGSPDTGILEAAGLEDRTSPHAAPRVRVDFSHGPVEWEVIERAILEEALRVAGGNVSEAARLVGLGRGALRYRLTRHGLAGTGDSISLPDEREAA